MTTAMPVNFHGAVLYGSRMGEYVFVALKPIVEAMGLEWSSQLKRVKRDPVLSEGMAIMAIPSDGGSQEAMGLKLDLVAGWLFTISALRIKSEEVRAKVILFQRECYSVLADHFLGKKKRRAADPYDRLSLQMVDAARLTFGVRAGVEVWFDRGLPRTPSMGEAFSQLDMFHSTEHESGSIVPDSPADVSQSRAELERIGKPVPDKKDEKP